MTTVKGSFAGGPVDLEHFNETPVLNLQWIGGNVLVQGRVEVTNADGDYQKVQIWLTHGYPPNVMDYFEKMMPPGHGGARTMSSDKCSIFLDWLSICLPTKSSKSVAQPIMGPLSPPG